MSDDFSLTQRQAIKIVAKYVGFQIGLFVLSVFALGFWNAIRHIPREQQSDGGAMLGVAVNALAFLLVLRSELRRHRIDWRMLGNWRITPVLLLLPYLLMIIGSCLVISEISNRMEAVLPTPVSIHKVFSGITDLSLYPVAAPLLLIVIAPVTEELICRGLILRGLLARFSPSRAIIVSASLFALLHLNPWQIPTALGIGLVFGWVCYRTGSLLLCVLGHALFNSISLLAPGFPFVIRGFNTTPAAGSVDFQPWWLNFAAVALLAGGILWFRRCTPAIAGAGRPVPPVVPTTAEAAV
jgi:membrane protease YdiL (CAAX protease family)